jgi:hypothetical protein
MLTRCIFESGVVTTRKVPRVLDWILVQNPIVNSPVLKLLISSVLVLINNSPKLFTLSPYKSIEIKFFGELDFVGLGELEHFNNRGPNGLDIVIIGIIVSSHVSGCNLLESIYNIWIFISFII